MREYEIRAAREADHGSIVRICKESMAATYGSFLDEAALEPWVHGEEIARYVERMASYLYVAARADEVLAVAAVEGDLVDLLWVRQDLRRGGIGGELLDWVEREVVAADGFDTARLECFVPNQASIEFYEQQGYQPVRQYPDETAGVDKVLLRKRLSLLAVCFALLVGCGEEVKEWDGAFAEPVARAEHPRPDLWRDSFISLNTVWQFAYDPDDVGLDEEWYRKGSGSIWQHEIQVPFAWESELSGLVSPREEPYRPLENLGVTSYRGVAWYRLKLPGYLPAHETQHWHLVFGAVDFRARVFIGGVEVGSHEGGYDPFSVDLSAHVEPEQRPVIVVRVEDWTDVDDTDLPQPLGKQGGYWYTRTSGIWQSVYLERRPALYVESYRVVPEPDSAQVRVRVELSGAGSGARLEVSTALESAPDQILGTASQTFSGDEVEVVVPLDAVSLWEPESPVLHSLDLALTGEDGDVDRVHGYYGLARVTTDWLPGHGPGDGVPVEEQYQAVFLNGRPRYLSCVLDQSYWPDGIMTAPSLEAIRGDLELARLLGFNCIRVHIKADEPVKYRLIDELGFLLVYDIVSLDLRAANHGAEFAGRGLFEDNLRRTMARDANHPSIVGWVVFNENWGLSTTRGGNITPLAESPEVLAWASEMVALAREIDPTRPVEDNSAGGLVDAYEHFDTDLQSFHWYGDDMPELRALLDEEEAGTFPGSDRNFVGGAVQDGAPWMISEVATFSFLGTPSEDTYCDLWSLINEVRRRPKLVGYVVTELTDVEFELNGLVDYDRNRKPSLCEEGGLTMSDLFAASFIAFDDLPQREVAASQSVTVPLRYSHWSDSTATTLRLVLRWTDGSAQLERYFDGVPYGIASIPGSALPAPSGSGLATLVAEVFDRSGERLAANRIVVLVL